jgi:hypothetical protein
MSVAKIMITGRGFVGEFSTKIFIPFGHPYSWFTIDILMI